MFHNKTKIAEKGLTMSSNMTYFDEQGCQSDVLIIIMKIQPIFLLIFGFLANLLSFVVLIQPRLRRRPTFSYLAFLSLSNAFLSLIHSFFTILGVYFGLTVEHLPLFIFCRLLNRFLIDLLTHFSLFTLTAVDLDRCRTVISKKNQNQQYNQNMSVRVRGCIKPFLRVCCIELSFACILFVFNLHWLLAYGYKTIEYQNDTNIGRTTTMCTIPKLNGQSSLYVEYLTFILPIIELVLFGISPFLISFIATIVILRHVSLRYTSINHQSNKRLKQSRRRMELHLSILLISLNCVFILFTTPHNVFNVFVGHFHEKLDDKYPHEKAFCSVAFTQKSLDLLQQCYFMSTFFLYILTNKRFREEFVGLLKRIVCR